VKIRNKEYPHIGVALVFLVLVLSIWVGYLYIAFQALKAASPAGIGTFGQFGDTFGSINALFTGLAFAGLVYTALLQREQVQSQRQELDQQLRDSEANRLALSRGKREQFLTARLNATVAMLQATEAMLALALKDDDYARLAAMRETRKLKHQVAILLCEAKLGFEADWSVEVERTAIRDYLATYFRELHHRCVVHHSSPLSLFEGSIHREKLEMSTLCEQIRERHSSTADHVTQFMTFLADIRDRKEAAQHIESFRHTIPNL
jgi:hypothetical protein